jgi:exodeoxyribonuclease VII small subunit
MTKTDTTKESFEAGLERLEKIVQNMKEGDIALEQALKLFEEGMETSANCRKKLEAAENRIEILLKKGDETIVAEPFSPGIDSPSS